jgi:hypothetical protein
MRKGKRTFQRYGIQTVLINAAQVQVPSADKNVSPPGFEITQADRK